MRSVGKRGNLRVLAQFEHFRSARFAPTRALFALRITFSRFISGSEASRVTDCTTCEAWSDEAGAQVRRLRVRTVQTIVQTASQVGKLLELFSPRQRSSEIAV